MTTIPDHLIDKAARAMRQERAYRAAAAFGVPDDAHTDCTAMIARAVLEAVADDLRAEGAREALDGYAAAEEDSFLSLHVKDAPIAAAQCTHAAITAREYRDAQYPEETGR